jgi:hypothetical protein
MSAQPQYEPTEAAIADRAADVLAYWRRSVNRHYDKFYTMLNEMSNSDDFANVLFGLWINGDTAEMGSVLSKKLHAELAETADQYARDEFAGVLRNLDERIPW